MPKVQLSTLITDIKGKSGGSVFSKNAGGNYFRSNPSHGKRGKSTNSMIQRFPAVASVWATLSDIEKQAWLNAAPSFPTINKFGAPRTPSAYELFMSVNGALVSANYPVLTLPPVKRDLPVINEASIVAPDLFQFVPNSFFNVSAGFVDSFQPYISTPALADAAALVASEYHSIRVEASNYDSLLTSEASEVTLFSKWLENGDKWSVTLSLFNSVSFQVNCRFSSTNFSSHKYWSFPSDFLKNTLVLGLLFGLESPSSPTLIINGSIRPGVYTSDGTFVNRSGSPRVTIGLSDNPLNLSILCADYRLYTSIPTLQECELIALGYCFNNEFLQYGLNNLTDNFIANFGTSGPGFNATLVEYNSESIFVKRTLQLMPKITLVLDSLPDPSFDLHVFSTRPMSYGKSFAPSALRTISKAPFDTTEISTISSSWSDSFGLFIIGSSINFGVTVFDPRSGQSRKPKPAKKDGPRFKAGADLMGKVN